MAQQQIIGFTDFDIDLVIKVGGPLTEDLAECRRLVDAIVALCREGQRILVIPGRGRTDRLEKSVDRELSLGPETAHRAWALAQDQIGLLLSDRCFSNRLLPCETLVTCRAALDTGHVAVLLPSRLVFDLDPIEKSFEVTSDAVAAWVAWLVGARRLVVLTDVDGVFADGRIGSKAHLIGGLGADQLREMGHTAIDACAAAFLEARQMDCTILNGRHPQRLRDWAQGQSVIGTTVFGHADVPALKAMQPPPWRASARCAGMDG